MQEFDELENPRHNPITGERLQNYWGYSTIAFFAPKGGYSSAGALGQQVQEFKEMVRDLHAAGIEVILDVVFNHTAEGNETGPTLCFRGLDNSIYYMLDAQDPRGLRNFSGCGNTLNCNHPIVRSLIIDCLRYWVVEMHVDGFRFDLGSVLGRDIDGNSCRTRPSSNASRRSRCFGTPRSSPRRGTPRAPTRSAGSPVVDGRSGTIGSATTCAGIWRGDPGMVPALATRLAGSSDLYLRDGRKPFHSINFVCSHDGFTLNDLVSYARKHNEENGEGNLDGSTPDQAANYGVEGPTEDPPIESIRNRQVKNLLATLLLSLGTPMLLGGDEFRRTQRGNNNPWCQNNEISWYDWGFARRHADVHRFCRELIAFRRPTPRSCGPSSTAAETPRHNRIPDITWLTEEASQRTGRRTANAWRFSSTGTRPTSRRTGTTTISSCSSMPGASRPVRPGSRAAGQGGMVSGDGHRHRPRSRLAGRGRANRRGNLSDDGSLAGRVPVALTGRPERSAQLRSRASSETSSARAPSPRQLSTPSWMDVDGLVQGLLALHGDQLREPLRAESLPLRVLEIQQTIGVQVRAGPRDRGSALPP